MNLNDNKITDWTFRVLFSIAILFPIFNYDNHYYYLITLTLTVVSFWLYIYRLKVVALVILAFVLFLHYQHLGKLPE